MEILLTAFIAACLTVYLIARFWKLILIAFAVLALMLVLWVTLGIASLLH